MTFHPVAAAASGVGQQPWQFTPEAYGAKGNGKVIADLVLNSTATATSASAAFTAADTGKTIMINGGATATGAPLVTTITVVNPTTVTLGSAASVTGTAYQAVYGTDDTAAINSAISAAKTYALANDYYAEILFAAKIYMLTSGPTQTTSPAAYNTQIQIPYPDLTGAGRKLVLALTGAGGGGFFQFWESVTPNLSGTCLVSTVNGPGTVDPTFSFQSVIGGPNGGGAFTGGFANTKIVVSNIEVVCGLYTNLYAYDFGFLAGMRVKESSAQAFAPSGVGGGNAPVLNTMIGDGAYVLKLGTGLRSPVSGNNADVTVDEFVVEGYTNGIHIADHFTAGRIGTIYNNIGVLIDPVAGNGNVQFPIVIANLDAEAYNGGISIVGGGAGLIPVYINMATENSGPAYDVSDAGGCLRGVIHFSDPTNARVATVNGGANVDVISDVLGPGIWGSPPAVPATTVAATNTSGRPATVYITSGGGAVTVIKRGATTTGLQLTTAATSCVSVQVPVGGTIALTYASTAPTWIWDLG